MEKQQPSPPPPPPPAGGNQTAGMKKKSKRMPSPQEMVAHYEKQGMATQEASLKVISDLQGAIFRMVAANSKRGGDSSNSNPNSSSPQVISAKLDAVHARLVQLEMKLDSKPSYPQALALGVASASVWNGAVQLWNTVRRTTSP